MNTSSCDLKGQWNPLDEWEAPKATQQEPKLATGLENVPAEKQEEWLAYAVKLRKKFPHMKPDRIKRKVAEYFKVKLV